MNDNTPRNSVTPEAIGLLEGMGFITLYDADGNVIEFMERGQHAKCVADGKLPPLVG